MLGVALPGTNEGDDDDNDDDDDDDDDDDGDNGDNEKDEEPAGKEEKSETSDKRDPEEGCSSSKQPIDSTMAEVFAVYFYFASLGRFGGSSGVFLWCA